MRRIVSMMLIVLFTTLAAGNSLAQKADKCAAEKKAVDTALENFRTADSAYIAALDAVADAYDELRDAQAFAATMNKVFTNAAKKKSAAENAYNNCVETAANNNCKAELDASLKADAEFAAAQTASWEADMAVVAAQAELDNAKANFRAKIEAKMAAKEELDKARIALSKCQGGRIR